jgi:hypothetical protein
VTEGAEFIRINRLEGRRVLSCRMSFPDRLPPNISYRGYSLQLMHRPPQWQVVIAPMLAERPELSTEKRLVRGWNEDEVVKRAKVRVDDMMDQLGFN